MTGAWAGVGEIEEYDLAVAGSTMHVVDTSPGEPFGPVLVFLHGNPTSTFLWRKVVARLAGRFRCIGIDLIGMGRSGKPDIGYDWSDQRAFLTAGSAPTRVAG